jgi:regulator of protease activity HflC (stomatin/prohibitin superfamily)
VGLILMIILLAISFKPLDQLDFGLNYNSITLQIEEDVYADAGLYFLGVGCYFITYPRTVQTIEFIAEENDRLQTRTSDGLPVKLSVSFQYRYNEDTLLDLYLTYKKQEIEVYENTAKAVIANAATQFDAYTFFNDKQGIANAMQIDVSRVFQEELFASIDAFQITRVELPSQFQSAILDSIQAKQNISERMRYKENMAVTFSTQVLIANQTKFQSIALAQGEAAQRSEEAEANVYIVQQEVEAEMYAYGNLSVAVGLNTSESLDYIWWSEQLQKRNTKDYLVGVDPTVLSRRA